MSRPLIVLEFNELTPRLMDAFIAEGRLPGFKRLRDQSLWAVTDAEEAPPTLEPWIQWVSVHTGLPYADHKVFDLNDGVRYAGARVWDRLSDAGKSVWICGSMNAAVKGGSLNGLFLPDPWSAQAKAFPDAYFEPYLKFVRTYVQEYSSERPSLAPADYLRFVRFMVANGLSPDTVTTTLRQLAHERVSNVKWRRATILDRLQWDLFRANYRRRRPDFSTFFLNSTAHFQHYYWRCMEPEAFELAPTEEQLATYRAAILHGYESMDAIVGQCLEMAPDATIVLCTALGQAPLTRYEAEGGKMVFKAHDPHAVTAFAGVADPYAYQPVMAEEFQLRFADPAAAQRALQALSTLSLGSEPLMRVRADEATLYVGCGIYHAPEDGAAAVNAATGERRPFFKLFYPLEGLKSGGHHPDGILWIRVPGAQPARLERKVRLTELAPTFQRLVGVDPGAAYPEAPMPEVERLLEPASLAAE